MILHNRKIIFIHIPKNAGSSIERYFGVKPFNWRVPNYETLTGWCPKRCIHLQHATPKQLLETDLITEDDWSNYVKFTFVRNTWDRALSDYLWMMSDRNISGTFEQYLTKQGAFRHFLRDKGVPEYRGDHVAKQVDYTHLDGIQALDQIYRFENLGSDFRKLCALIGIEGSTSLPHEKESAVKRHDYSYYYNNKIKRMVAEEYIEDIDAFDFKFVDKKPVHEKLFLGSMRLRLLKYKSSR